jgi:LmbE family N-acetylglucosaminyl deacetylase
MAEENDLSRVLVVAAHPDDPEFGCAGTVARWIAEGKEVFYLVCTRGNRGTDDPTMTEAELAVLREGEQRAAAAHLGVKEVSFLDQTDGEVQANLQFRGEVVRCIRTYRPGIVCTHDPTTLFYRGSMINHTDHRATGLVTTDAIYPIARDRLQYPEQVRAGLQPHKVKEIYYFGTHEPNQWEDITGTIDRKVEALRRHQSQFKQMDEMEKRVRDFSRNAGQGETPEYAEAFRRIVMRF